MVDRDIYRAAQFMIDRHGPRAAAKAAIRVQQLANEGSTEAAALWRDIYDAIKHIAQSRPGF